MESTTGGSIAFATMDRIDTAKLFDNGAVVEVSNDEVTESANAAACARTVAVNSDGTATMEATASTNCDAVDTEMAVVPVVPIFRGHFEGVNAFINRVHGHER